MFLEISVHVQKKETNLKKLTKQGCTSINVQLYEYVQKKVNNPLCAQNMTSGIAYIKPRSNNKSLDQNYLMQQVTELNTISPRIPSSRIFLS